jgi:5,10-methylenetetrahydromethanopterin reductase
MRIGIFGGRGNGIDDIVATARGVEADGFASFWLEQIWSFDALTALAVVGREVPRIELGTAVVPVWTRHPQALSIQAKFTQQVTGGRLALGIGLLHQIVVESMLGMRFERPVAYMREYLSILLPLVQGQGNVSFAGKRLTYHGPIDIEADPVPVLLAALGPQMLALAGREAAGTVTWMTGPKTLETHVVPSITAAAREAGRPAPRIVAALPVAVSGDVDAARERAARTFAVYDTLPSYKAMLDREGAAGPGDVAIVGDEDAVASQIRELADAGVTDFVAVEYHRGDEIDRRTRALLRSLL